MQHYAWPPPEKHCGSRQQLPEDIHCTSCDMNPFWYKSLEEPCTYGVVKVHSQPHQTVVVESTGANFANNTSHSQVGSGSILNIPRLRDGCESWQECKGCYCTGLQITKRGSAAASSNLVVII